MFGDRLISTEDNQLFRCPYWHMGYCNASLEVDADNSERGECLNPEQCRYRKESIGEKNV